jgi:hypothetical protein
MQTDPPRLFLTLRHNLDPESDVQLALDEARALCKSGKIDKVPSKDALIIALQSIGATDLHLRFVTDAVRPKGVVAFVVTGATWEDAERIICRCAFAQDVLYFCRTEPPQFTKLARKLSRLHHTGDSGHVLRAVTLTAVLDYSAKMVFNRDRGIDVAVALDHLVDGLLEETPPITMRIDDFIADAMQAKKTSLYLTHELHLYKGKFFPRLARSLINRFAPLDSSLVADIFAGSGTALLEASLLGHHSIGIDVDPTSVLISSHKLAPADMDSTLLQAVCLGISSAIQPEDDRSLFFGSGCTYTLEGWEASRICAPQPMRGRLIKRGNEEGYDLIGEVENDSAKVLHLIRQVPAQFAPILKVCLSHALTKKLRLRFVGIGNGRFTIDVAKVRVLDLFLKKVFHLVGIAEAFAWLKRNGLNLPIPEVVRGSAKDFSSILQSRKVDLILTSPPYIPASSGREHYARARAIPLIFSGAASEDELEQLDRAFIGEMSGGKNGSLDDRSMPPKVREILNFLANDAQRQPKHLPTLHYYSDLRKVFESVRGTLRESGKAIFVVGTTHTFYVHKTREILHTADAVGAVAELGEAAGLKVSDVLTIPLKKSGGLNARPRSTDDYSESVVVFGRN